MFCVALLLLLAAGQLEATIQGELLTYINDLRSLHSSGPLINSPTATAFAQKAADKLAKDGDINAVYNSKFSTNHCVYTGKLSQLPQTCTVAWYTTMRDHSWCTPQVNGKARPFINMIWNATSRAGTGISKGGNGKYYVVTYFSPKKNSDVKGNVHPVKIITKASDKAKCASGYTRFGSSCFKFHPEKVTWEEAVTKCAQENATLTSVRNQKEEKFLRALQERGKGKGWMWIGLHDRNNEGHFTWLDGLEFANGVCAPVSAYGGHLENCVAWTTEKPMSCWSDKKCADRNPFMCRIPVDGKSTFRTEILFKNFRWNPNFRDKNSKAFRDLRRGLRVTFNEVFQRSSGRIGGGFRSLKIKSVRPLSIQGKRRGTAITLSIQFRAKVADPTLKFQKFLRPSERLISVTVDSPVVHQSALARTVCSFPCKRAANHYCHTWPYHHNNHHVYHTNTYGNTYQHAGYTNTGYPGYTTYHNTGYGQCPSYCSHYSYSTCPSYCSKTCCTQSINPTAAAPTATQPPTTAKPPATVAANTGTQAPAPTKAPVTSWNGYSSYQPYAQCNTCQTLYSHPICYALCDESCCKQKDDVESLVEKVVDMKVQLKKFEDLLHSGKSGDYPSSVNGNAVPIFNSKAKLAVRNLQRNIAKLQTKINLAQKKHGAQNLDDIMYEKTLKVAEKQSGGSRSALNYEKELDELEKDVDDSDHLNAIPDKKEDSKDDLETFDLDIEALDLAERSSDFKNTSLHSEDKQKEGPSKNRYNGPNGAYVQHEIEQSRGSEYHQEQMSYNGPERNKDVHSYQGPESVHETGNYKGPESYHSTGTYNGPQSYENKESYTGAPNHHETGNNTSSSYGFPEMNKTYEGNTPTSSHYTGPNSNEYSKQNRIGAHYVHPEEQPTSEADTSSSTHTSTNTTYGHTYSAANTNENSRQNRTGAHYVHPEEQRTSEADASSSSHTSTNTTYGHTSIASSTSEHFRQNRTGAHYVHPEEHHMSAKGSPGSQNQNGMNVGLEVASTDKSLDHHKQNENSQISYSTSTINSTDLPGSQEHIEPYVDLETRIPQDNTESVESQESQNHDELNVGLESSNHHVPKVERSHANNSSKKEDDLFWVFTNKTKAKNLKPTNYDNEPHPYDVHLDMASSKAQHKETDHDIDDDNDMEHQGHDTPATHTTNANIGMIHHSNSLNSTFDDLQNSTLAGNSLDKTDENFNDQLIKNTTNMSQENSSHRIDAILDKTPVNDLTTNDNDIDESIINKKDIDHENLNPKFHMHKNIDNVHKQISVKNGTGHMSINHGNMTGNDYGINSTTIDGIKLE